MNRVVRVPYSVAGELARLAATIAPAGGGKVLASLRARRGIRARYARWGAHGRDPLRPLLWIHAPSVGEGLQARPVIAMLKNRRPDLQVAYTYYSPSAERFAGIVRADFADYLPFDTIGDADFVLDALRPTALVFSKLDVWPLLVSRAVARGIPVGLISASLSGESGRSSRLAGLLLGDAYRALSAVGAASAADGGRLAALGVRPERVTVTGDSRYDQVWDTAQSVDRQGPLLRTLTAARPTLVAGSTWPSDEAPLREAWREVRSRNPSARLIIAPHEPDALHLPPITRWAALERFDLTLLSDVERHPVRAAADVILVDRVGALGELYALADIAFVGGGFHDAGLHSVIEPAAFGAPVLFGPRHSANADAATLLEKGGAFAVGSATELAMRLLALFAEPEARLAAGTRARDVVKSGLGGAERSAALIESLLDLPARPATS